MASKNTRQNKRKQQRKQSRQVDVKPLIIMPKDIRVDIPRVDFSAMLRAIAARAPRVWDAFLQYLHYFEHNHYKSYSIQSIKNINSFLHCFFTAMIDEEFFPSPDKSTQLTQMSHVLQHLTAISSYKTTDSYLDAVLPMVNNVPKILCLQNPRCDIQIDQARLFEAHPYLASLWFIHYLLSISSPTERQQRNMFNHLKNMDERFVPPHHSLSSLYFGCTYHNPEAVRHVKKIINKGIKAVGVPTFTNSPDPKSIAIVTERWHRNHAVYKSAGPLVEQLKDKYKLTLVWTNPPDTVPPNMVKDYFDKVVYCYFKPDGELVVPDEVKNNDFQLVHFPDVGMSDESIWMSNMRIAPIQSVGYGHPDTTGDGSEIDYFIGGDIEKESANVYSETMVLLPGLAQEPAWPTVERQNNYIDDGVVRINGVFGPDKFNFRLLQVFEMINKAVQRISPQSNHEFHFFGSPGLNRYGALPSFVREVTKLLPNAQIHSEWEYVDYMREAEKHDFAMNSYPFGCYNVLVEALWMGLPFLSLVGKRFYNKAGMYLNERVGMSENNFHDVQPLVAKAAELITNPDALRQQREHLADLDLRQRLFTLKSKDFLKAVDYIIANHPFNETVLIGEV